MDINKYLTSWLKELDKFELPNWDKLPDIDLYMEQLTTYLDRITSIYSKSSYDKIITPSMINNYVKAQVITSPNQKRYSKDHIAAILAICSLKLVLPIIDIKNIFNNDDTPIAKKYLIFKKTLSEKTSNKANYILNELDKNKNSQIKQLNQLALSLAIEGFVDILISERILYMIELEKEDIENKRKKKAKKIEKVTVES